MKNIFAIIGSASANSSNLKLVQHIARLTSNELNIEIFEDLKQLPHFDPQLSIENTPESIVAFRKKIETADGILICTPEYVFSIPSGLKNAIEWCVSTTIFENKPTALITASAHGQKGHEELQLIMRTVQAKFTDESCLLIQGVKGKVDGEGKIVSEETIGSLNQLVSNFVNLIQFAE